MIDFEEIVEASLDLTELDKTQPDLSFQNNYNRRQYWLLNGHTNTSRKDFARLVQDVIQATCITLFKKSCARVSAIFSPLSKMLPAPPQITLQPQP
jgi:hypothetical protein